MESLVLSIAAACLAYLISEINTLQKQVQRISVQIAVLETLIPKRKDD